MPWLLLDVFLPHWRRCLLPIILQRYRWYCWSNHVSRPFCFHHVQLPSLTTLPVRSRTVRRDLRTQGIETEQGDKVLVGIGTAEASYHLARAWGSYFNSLQARRRYRVRSTRKRKGEVFDLWRDRGKTDKLFVLGVWKRYLYLATIQWRDW